MAVKQVLIALDQLANTLLGGWADETLSARCYRVERSGGPAWPRCVIDTLFFFDPAHCETSYIAELKRQQLPRAYHVDTA